MKTQTPEIRNYDKPQAEAKRVSFAHLSFRIDADAEPGALAEYNYGFPAALEDNLYETGTLIRNFLKC